MKWTVVRSGSGSVQSSTLHNVCFIFFTFQDLYISELEGGNRSKAMNRLRVPPLAEELRVSCP